MADVWPVELPTEFEQNSFAEGVADGLLEYQPDQGPPVSRRRSTSAPRSLSGSLQMTAAEIGVLRAFFDTTLLGGALPFQFPDQMQDGMLLVKFKKGGGPSWSAVSDDLYRVQIMLLVLP